MALAELTDVPLPKRHIRDLACRSGAELLAAQIEEFWHSRGHTDVRAWVEEKPAAVLHIGSVYNVRTNLVRGLPPSATKKYS